MAKRCTTFIEPLFKLPSNTISLVHLVYMENKIGANFIEINTWRKIFGTKFDLGM